MDIHTFSFPVLISLIVAGGIFFGILMQMKK